MKPLLRDVKSLMKDSIYVKEILSSNLNDQFHFHNEYEIALIIKSSGKRIVGDNIEDFTDGDLVLMGPHLPHISYNNYVETPEVHALVIYFNPDWLTDTYINSSDLTDFRKLLEDMNRGIKIIGRTKKKVTESMVKLKKSSGLERVIIILKILEIISRSKEYEYLASEGYANSYSKKDVKRIDEVYKYVMKNFTDNIMLEDIAAIANMTPTAFCKFFKNKTQKTFSNFVNEVRIGYACKLLCDENLSISQICFKCGFNNLTNFIKNFKRFAKMIPSEYKANLNKL